MNTFYMVFVEGGATPACKHDSLDSAEKEAKRLATLLKKKAYVFYLAFIYICLFTR